MSWWQGGCTQDSGAGLAQLERGAPHCCSRSCVWGQPWGRQTAREATECGCVLGREISASELWLPQLAPKVSPSVSVFPSLLLSPPT